MAGIHACKEIEIERERDKLRSIVLYFMN